MSGKSPETDVGAAAERAFERAARTLVRQMDAPDHWTGELSSSALATAVAAGALIALDRSLGEPGKRRKWIEAGLEWLARHANPDGGWGDTPRSPSNLSTTALGWAACRAGNSPAAAGAAQWLAGRGAAPEPASLAARILARYGKDRTFSVPILMFCGATEPEPAARGAWLARAPRLPFEAALLPRGAWGAIGLPVVSYALPALIAVGLARHRGAPPRNPLLRALREAAAPRALRILESIQPSNGGFLEATPLTAFVTLSLAFAGLGDHPSARRGARFLEESMRPDGSWPIDTNLAVWLTTLSVQALGLRRGEFLPPETAEAVLRWLLACQHRRVHPYTGAAPGGWAWTDLPGGVPDADDTAGALLALKLLGPEAPEARAAAIRGAEWLLGLQNRDGGAPTFCRGWTRLPFDRSSPDITAHALRAWRAWREDFPNPARLDRAIARAVRYLAREQQPDGSWIPLWFGNDRQPDEANRVYGTARVLQALTALPPSLGEEAEAARTKGLERLCRLQLADGGWSGGPVGPASVEETALAVDALACALARIGPRLSGESAARIRAALGRGAAWLAAAIEENPLPTARPIGLYFARLWYYERLYPLIFAVSALRRAAELGGRPGGERAARRGGGQ